MFNIRNVATKTAAALLVAGTLSAQANEAAAQGVIDLNACIGNSNFQICFGTNSRGSYGNHGYPGGHYGHEREAVEISRVPSNRRCPRGTESESVISNTYPGTYQKTKICYVYR